MKRRAQKSENWVFAFLPPFESLNLKWKTILLQGTTQRFIPRDDMDDYGESIIKTRQEYFESATGKKIDHVGKYSIDPQALKGILSILLAWRRFLSVLQGR